MSSECSNENLKAALAGTLPPAEEDSLHRHLEKCFACTAALEDLAGGAALCRETATLLLPDEYDVSLPHDESWSEVDFTVEYLEPTDQSSDLGRLGGYDVQEIIGRGGMGVVLKAYDRELKRCVAIKILAPHLAQSSLAKRRFTREAQAAAAVVHPNVLAIHQVQPTGRLPFLVMPLVAGESLAERLKNQGTLELKEILRIGMQAAAGLAAAHEQGLVHRDIKPANILLEKGIERAVLTDFGLARAADDLALTRHGVIAGTPQYMSPEQARGESLDGRSDLFSLGCVLYEMATGVSPFLADSTFATLRRLVDEAPVSIAARNAELPPWFVAIVEKLLEKDPTRRFESAHEVSEVLERCLAHLQQPTNVRLPAGLAARARVGHRLPTRGRWIALGTLLVILAWGGSAAFIAATEEKSNISGEWMSDEWGKVTLIEKAAGEYEGTYSNTLTVVANKEENVEHSSTNTLGQIHVAWNRIEGRYNGTWNEGNNRFGTLSVRLVGDELRGGWTTSREAKTDPGTPALADLVWVRYQMPGFEPVIERTLSANGMLHDSFLDLDSGRILSLPRKMIDSRSDDPKRSAKEGASNIEDLHEWITESGADVVARPGSEKQMRVASLTQIDGLGPQVGENGGGARSDFNRVTAEMLLSWLAETEKVSVKTDEIKKWGYGLSGVYSFKTREGRMGILETVSATRTSVTLRYKLLKLSQNLPPTAAASGNAVSGAVEDAGQNPRAEEMTFGPIIERTVSDISSGKDCFLNLERGELLTPPASVRELEDMQTWAEANDADVAACGDAGGNGLRIFGGLAGYLIDWDATAQEVISEVRGTEETLRRYKANNPALQGPREMGFSNLWYSASESGTFFIKTRQGKIGLLQLIRFTPTVVVRATYPGASPKVIEDTVARPIEEEVRGVENMLNLSSKSGDDGVMELTVAFKPGTDVVKSQKLVQNRVSKAEARLPEVVRHGVTTVTASPDLEKGQEVKIRYKLLQNEKSDSRQPKRQRFVPVEGKTNDTHWSIQQPPSIFSKTNWAVMAFMTIGGEARIELPDDKQPRCVIKLVKGDDNAITIQVEDAAKKSTMKVSIARDQSAQITVDGEGYDLSYKSVQVNPNESDTSPFALVIVRRVESQLEENRKGTAAGSSKKLASAASGDVAVSDDYKLIKRLPTNIIAAEVAAVIDSLIDSGEARGKQIVIGLPMDKKNMQPEIAKLMRNRYNDGKVFDACTRTIDGDQIKLLVSKSIVVADNFQAVLRDGTRVSLVGCCENPSLTHSWWNPKGIPLAGRPYDTLGASVVPTSEFVAREVAVQLDHPSSDVSTAWVFEPAASSAGGGAPTKTGSNVNNLRAIAAEIPINADAIDVRFGIAIGEWATVAEKTIGTTADGTAAAGVSGASVVFAPSNTAKDQLVQLVSHDISDRAVRLVLVNKRGKTFLPVHTTSGSAGNLQQLQATFNTAAVEDVHRVELHTRAYQWVLFKNVRVYPTADKTSVERAKAPTMMSE